MKQKWISALLALTLAVGMSPFAFAEFSDVTNVWCETYVADLVNRKIVDGYSDGLYHPQDAVTRGAVAKMLLLSMKSAGSGIDVSTKNAPFTDMKGNWAEQYVTPLTGIKVILPSEYPNGYGSGTAMSRLETIKAIVRAYLYAHPEDQLGTDVTLDFTDSNQISKEDAPFVKKGVDLGIISGYEDGSFKPGASIQRSTAAAMMSRFMQAVGKISDKLGAGSENRVDGKLPEPADKAPEIQNVEWVLKPQSAINYKGTFKKIFSEFSKDGMSCYWANNDHRDPLFIDLQGNTYQFKGVSDVGEFVGGVAPAMDTKTGKWGYIDLSGKWICKPELSDARDITKYILTDGSSKYYGLAIKNGIDGYVGLDGLFVEDWDGTVDLDKTYGKQIETPTSNDGYEVWDDHTESGLFKIEKHMGEYSEEGSYFGFCDREGNTIVAPTYKMPPLQNLHSTYISADFYDDCIVMTHKISATWTCIEDIYDGKTGKLIYSHYNVDEFGGPIKLLDNYGQGLFACDNGTGGKGTRLWGYMKPDGTEVIPPVFEKVTAFSNGYAWVNYQGQWGIIRLPK